MDIMIKCLKKYEFSHKINQARSVELVMDGKKYILFCVSENKGLDPWPEAFGYIDYPLSLVLFDTEGNKLWERTFGRGTVPGVWFTPFIAFDLDGDGNDEIYFVHNTDDARPFSHLSTFMDHIDPRTGETVAQHRFPAANTNKETMSHAFRHNLSAGYVHGKPVIVMEQGTYDNMYLQAYTTGMEPLWTRHIKKEDKGARASHNINVYDYNGDGVDELYYGERMISLATGEDLICYDEETFCGHSDIILPFYDDNGKYFLYTGRENGTYRGCDRVVLFDMDGNSVWRGLRSRGNSAEDHVHKGWIATVKPNYRKIAFAAGLAPGTKHQIATEHVFDAFTGEELNFTFPVAMSNVYPLDINGDGYHEFYANNAIYDSEGNLLADLGQNVILLKAAKTLDLAGEQLLLRRDGQNVVEIWGDDEAQESDRFLARHARGFHAHMAKLSGAGYNHGATVSCAM